MFLRRTLTMLTAAALSLGVLSGSPAQALEATPPPAAPASIAVSTAEPFYLAYPAPQPAAVIDVGALINEAASQPVTTQADPGVSVWKKKAYYFNKAKTKRFYARAKIENNEDGTRYRGYRVEAFTQKKVKGKWVNTKFCNGQRLDFYYAARNKSGSPHPGDWWKYSAIGAKSHKWQITSTTEGYYNRARQTIGIHAYYTVGSVCKYPYNVNHEHSWSGYSW